MAWTTEDEIAWSRNNPFRTSMGVRIERVEADGRAEISIPVTENMLQSAGVVHGGILCTLIDTVLGTVVRAALQRPVPMATIDLNVSFLRPGGVGRLYARGEVIKAGRRVVVGVADVLDDKGRKLATGRGSFMIQD